MEKECSEQRPVEANSTGGQGSRRAIVPSDDDELFHNSAFFVSYYIDTDDEGMSFEVITDVWSRISFFCDVTLRQWVTGFQTT